MIKRISKEKWLFISFISLGVFSSFLKAPYNGVAFIELGLGFVLLTYVYLKSAKRQHKNGVLSQWSNPSAFAKMKLNNRELFLFFLGIVMIVAPVFSFVLQILLQ